MSLKVWLPLNGSLENKGISDLKFSVSGSEAYSSGKVSNNAFNFTGSNFVCTNSTLKYKNNFTVCAWVKVDSSISSTQYAFGESRIDATMTGWGLNAWTNYWAFSNRWINSGLTTSTRTSWNHVAMTVDGDMNVTTFLNGKIVTSVQCTTVPTYAEDCGISIGCFYYNNRDAIYRLVGNVNDFRIYDNCLSQEEIRKVSQGLFLHYKLSQPRGNDNLICNNPSFSSSTNTSWDISWDSDLRNNFLNYAGKSFTISFDYDISNIKTAGTWGTRIGCEWNYYKPGDSNLSYLGMWFVPGVGFSGKGTFSKTVTMSDNVGRLNSLGGFYIQCTSDYVKVSNVKVEIGSEKTEWMPNKSDKLYSNMLYLKEYDCSGFGNNGTFVNNISQVSDSPRYNGSYYLNETGHITFNRPIPNQPSNITISFWVKPNSKDGVYSIIASNHNYPNSGFWISTNCENHGLWMFLSGLYVEACHYELLENNTWYFVALTYDNGTYQWYLNGEPQSTNLENGTNTSIYFTDTISIGNGYSGYYWDTKNYDCIADFRMYATTLSQEDIKLMYNSPISICNNESLFCSELHETLDNRMAEMDLQIVSKGQKGSGIIPYIQGNNYYKLTDEGYLWIRDAGLVGYGAWWNGEKATTFGGLRIYTSNTKLEENHTYIIMMDVKGRLDSNLYYFRFSYNLGDERDNSLFPNPQVLYQRYPIKGENDMTAIYVFKITDKLYKTCQSSFSSFVAGQSYLSYNQFCMAYEYSSNTGEGTELLVKNLRMYDITDYDLDTMFDKAGKINMSFISNKLDKNFTLSKYENNLVNLIED